MSMSCLLRDGTQITPTVILNKIRKMKSWHPERIPINREEDYHTHYIGRTKNTQQFFGCHTFVFSEGYASNQDWENFRREYVVLYIFDMDGNHIETKHNYLGTTKECKGIDQVEILEEMIKDLGAVTYQNILVKPFKTIIDNIEFGLIKDEEFKSIQLMPSSTIALFEPWDGEYDT